MASENPSIPAPQATQDAPPPAPGNADALHNVTECDVSAGGSEGSEGLSILQLRAIDMLLYGETDVLVARTLGVSRMTLWRWQVHHPAFKAELARRRQLIWHTTADRYRRLLLKAADVLERDLDDRYDRKRFRAAYAVLQMSSRFQPVGYAAPGPADAPAAFIDQEWRGSGGSGATVSRRHRHSGKNLELGPGGS